MTPPADDAPLQGKLQKLGLRFVERSAAEIVVMRRHLEAVRAGEIAAVQQLQQLAHRMCGTGAVFGFAAVSASAGQIERLAERCAGSGAAMGSETFEQLLSSMAQLEQELGALGARLADKDKTLSST